MSWWRQNWRLGLGMIGLGLGLILLVVLWGLRRKQEAEKLQQQLQLMQGSLKVAGLEADKKARQVELKANEEAAKVLDAQILTAQRKTVEAVKKVEGMSDAEVAKAFHDLGY